jgi:hypothetical protein
MQAPDDAPEPNRPLRMLLIVRSVLVVGSQNLHKLPMPADNPPAQSRQPHQNEDWEARANRMCACSAPCNGLLFLRLELSQDESHGEDGDTGDVPAPLGDNAGADDTPLTLPVAGSSKSEGRSWFSS